MSSQELSFEQPREELSKEKYMQNTIMEASRKRPLGVSIIAVLETIQGIFLLMLGVLSLVAVSVAAWSTGIVMANGLSVNSLVVRIVTVVLGGVFLVVGLVLPLFGWHLWKLKRWAFWATVIIEVVLLLGSLWNVVAFPWAILTPHVSPLSMVISLVNSVVAFTQPFANSWSIVVGMIIIPIVILLYILADANVRTAFHT